MNEEFDSSKALNLDLLEYKINNETILTFSKIGEDLLIVEAGKKKVKLLSLSTFT